MMRETFSSTRLTFRRMAKTDVVRLVELCSDIAVSGKLSRMPHPYTEQDAHEWLDRQASMWAGDRDRVWGVELPGAGLIGGIGLHRESRMSVDGTEQWELGYWFGVPYWDQGFATEAGACVLAELDRALGPQIVTAGFATKNPQSGHVLEKIGFYKVDVVRDFQVLATGELSPTQLMLRPKPTGPNEGLNP
jgi:[ribosomal protein S5]-alanine N-acetyltransferase